MKNYLFLTLTTPRFTLQLSVLQVEWEGRRVQGRRAQLSFGQQQSEVAQIGAVYQDIPSCAP